MKFLSFQMVIWLVDTARLLLCLVELCLAHDGIFWDVSPKWPSLGYLPSSSKWKTTQVPV